MYLDVAIVQNDDHHRCSRSTDRLGIWPDESSSRMVAILEVRYEYMKQSNFSTQDLCLGARKRERESLRGTERDGRCPTIIGRIRTAVGIYSFVIDGISIHVYK